MAGKKPLAINGREFAVLTLLWEHGPLTVREIREHLTEDEEVPYTSVLSLLQIMEKNGHIRHKAEGKVYRYSAAVERRATTSHLIRDFINRFFQGSPEAFVMGLSDTAELKPAVWEKLQRELRKRQEK
jgi:BlaI family transcriptional regulator, penicillinase repressor